MSAAVPVIDGHNDLPWRLRVRDPHERLDIGTDLSAHKLHTDLPRLRKGGVGAQFWSVYVPVDRPEATAAVQVLEQVDLVQRLAERHARDLAIATTADDVERIAASGRVASLLGAEGGHCLDNSLGVLRALHRLGVRYLTLTHSRNTAWADSATDEPGVGGLSPFGHEVVREMNRLGMLVDLSHVAPSTMHAALDTTSAPAFFSHSSARALCDHPRNVPDDVLVRVRDTGGVVMVTFVPFFLNEACRQWGDELYRVEDAITAAWDTTEFERERSTWIAANPCPPSSVKEVADHVEHVREVAGVGAVGLGGDFDGTEVLPDGLHDVSAYPALFEELRSRGWSERDLRALGWDNTLRVLRETCG
ncbi:dipeptidase [Dactylosporangium sp. AC04546]|uniref:dipeptidase n=1 Tax=Dactylosporangium sp. AC04546 TaxID=2862460 RepID=UPI001EDCFB94|nr:dipeptidase [Dactylosporangium sp. AC04546]WVK84402.1 dipeptidase [Dactylosporangium sp. AC04546]